MNLLKSNANLYMYHYFFPLGENLEFHLILSVPGLQKIIRNHDFQDFSDTIRSIVIEGKLYAHLFLEMGSCRVGAGEACHSEIRY